MPRRIRRALTIALFNLTDKRLIGNVRWALTGNTIYAASQWAMIVVLARWTDTQTVGALALAFAITAPIIIFFNMQLRAIVATDVAGRNNLRQYFQTRLLTTVSALALILCCCPLLHRDISSIATILLIALSKAAESLSDILHGYWQLIERMELVGKSLAIRACLTLGTFTVAIITTRSLIWGSAAFLLGSIGVLLAYDVRQVKRAALTTGKPVAALINLLAIRDIERQTLAAMIRRALPLGAAAMLISLNSAIPRYFIGVYSGKEQLGIFSALSYFIVVGNLLTNAAGQTVLPRLARLYRGESRGAFKHTLVGLLAGSVAIAVASMMISMACGRRILLIYGAEYAAAYPAFLIVMGSAAIGYSLSIVNFSLNAIGAYDIQLPLFVVVTLVLLALCRTFIPLYGIVGAAMAVLISNVTQAALSTTVVVLRARRPAQTIYA